MSTTFRLGDSLDAGATAGTLDAQGPLDATTVDLVLSADVEPPSIWWRLTHPLQLFGLSDLLGEPEQVEPAEQATP